MAYPTKYNILYISILTLSCMPLLLPAQKIPLDRWQYIMADSTRVKWGDFDAPKWLRYYGLGFKDVNADRYVDLVAGRYIYHNPGGKMEGLWKRFDLGMNVDGLFFTEVDRDEFPDFIAEALPNVYWFEALNREGTAWRHQVVAQIPKTGHVNSQGFLTADVKKGGLPEILLASEKGIYCIQIPKKPNKTANWVTTLIAPGASDEGIGAADLDGDGDIDLASGREMEKGKGCNQLYWFENPGSITDAWNSHFIAGVAHDIDRVEAADLDGDRRVDLAITEERWPGLEPDASLYWFKNPGQARNPDWPMTKIVTEYSLNNLDAADIDRDGDIDLVTNEHKGKTFRLQIFENDGKAGFTERLIDTGKESHLGTQWVDLDGDGDLDLVSVVWDAYKFLHVWRNDAVSAEKKR
jgi:FG-GAP-like repeat